MPSRSAGTQGAPGSRSSSQRAPDSPSSSNHAARNTREGQSVVHNDVDPRAYYLTRLERAAALPASEQGADVKGFLRHQQLLDEAIEFFLTEFAVTVADGEPQLTPEVDAWAAPYLVRIVAAHVADANNDRLMSGTACIKFPKLQEMGAEGPFILQRYKDLYREAQEYEKKFKRWAPGSLVRMYQGSAVQAKQQLDSAQERGFTMDDMIEPKTAGLLQQSQEDWHEVHQAALDRARCAACTRVGIGLMRCSACKSVKYCSSACQKADWKAHKEVCASLAAAHADRRNRQRG